MKISNLQSKPGGPRKNSPGSSDGARMTKAHPTIVVSDHSSPLIRGNLIFDVGASCDPEGMSGITAVTNRLLLRGTRQKTRVQFENEVEQLGGQLVANTMSETCNISGNFLRREMDDWFELVTEAIGQPRFDPAECKRTIREFCLEWDAILEDDAQLGRAVLKRALFGESPYGHVSIGRRSEIKSLDSDIISEHFAKNFTSSRLLLAGAGDITQTELETKSAQLRASLPSSNLPIDQRTAPLNTSHRIMVINKPDRRQSQLITSRALPLTTQRSLTGYQTLALIFGGTFSSRLVQQLRVNRGISYGAHCWTTAFRKHLLVNSHADVDSEHVLDATIEIHRLWDVFLENGPTDEELSFAKDHQLNSLPFGLETASMEMAQRVRAHLMGRAFLSMQEKVSLIKSLSKHSLLDERRSLMGKIRGATVIVGTVEKSIVSKLQAHFPETAIEMHQWDDLDWLT